MFTQRVAWKRAYANKGAGPASVRRVDKMHGWFLSKLVMRARVCVCVLYTCNTHVVYYIVHDCIIHKHIAILDNELHISYKMYYK